MKVSRNIHGYFADLLFNAMRGASTDDDTLIRIVVLRSEIDLALICDEYQRRYKRSLARSIRADCSGDYCRLLLKLLNN